MVDLLSVVIGLLLGGIAVGVVVEVTGRGREKAPEPHKLTTAWRLSELQEPVLVARDVLDVEVPPGTEVLASGLVDPKVQAACRVREVPPVRAEFALDRKQRRAILFLGGVQQGSMALLTVDDALLARLETEYRRLADRSADYVERFRISELGGRSGVVVETEGLVQEVLPWKQRWMMRLEDHGHIIGVAVEKDPSELKERRVRVRGRLDKDQAGYAVIEAVEVRTVR